ncbi:DUF6622 family protein [Rhizobium rhizogenes]|uniref:DUF6622 family protein n=1 Tax=Rhizobium rhizogenes TaxID=359 RepID=UPI0028696B3A|nr:DUF6622 family protein [Rhizobium rhizogenes]
MQSCRYGVPAMPHIPAYVYGLFLLLLWMGVSRCLPRTIRVERLVIMPVIMTILSVRGFEGLFSQASVLDLAFAAAGLCVGMTIGWRHVSAWKIEVDRAKRSLSLPGDIMMLVIILTTFAFEFLLHVGAEMHAAWFSAPAVPPLAAAVWVGFTGMSLGRSLHLLSRYVNVPERSADQLG